MTQGKISVKYLPIFIAVVSLLLSAPSQSVQPPQISSLTAEEESRLERQRTVVANIIRDSFGYVRLEGSLSEIYYLQKIIDRQLIPESEKFDLQALGVVLGDIMARNLGLRWVKVEDRYGHSRALQFENTQNLFFPVTMISRRIKSGTPISVQALYDDTEKGVKALIYERSKYRQLPKPKYTY